MTSTHEVDLKEKVNPATTPKEKQVESERFIVTFDLCHLQSMDQTEVLIKTVTKIKHRDPAGESATPPSPSARRSCVTSKIPI